MRFFVALEIPSENIAEFQSIQYRLHTLIPQAKLTNVDKIHLTLAFVGEQDEGLKENLITVITSSTNDIPTFEVTPAYIDGFPQIHHPEVLWVGVKGDIDKIHIIRERIKDDLQALRLPVDERRFVPHISVAKLNHSFQIDRNLEVRLEEMMQSNFTPIQITSIKLFESVPEGGLHTHNTLAEIKLI
ncbi:2'-5' RNA ligase [Candidatus Daviesbacteria bacterium RIFCSPLOWO2_02_FULL_41_8]|uniref:RNA 2',3'-cyclic phosphodiesterase n=3 Tax=Candidatus Daviesiibacteriota TaxID=1752718 RepID=A0A1F5NL03_9BACT|nr:MAG: 2'-5' RNA ligase [Candidatus Daviesbacteria bacterium RIFCSPHIGHO2_01_FULL_41_23]OGE33879.1 MAG: 2'-5' RNA ligase [Candidatus Daviesbacteria bacterium RIFCSPHIGHO2_02_FULL_41_10]OGE62290.1 MAG: 2'-5' RNA ligase [Candidatus Daviesbacteria bacterium RIFCSPLOWO2_01_FULL_41_32]OGE78386.1 MAG: 2'-5' RNA ligase [Candidatus Daviesbacteria bacterium RIFCSPLOWO2_02_FULL_41_8]